jgi:DNA adenine methylase
MAKKEYRVKEDTGTDKVEDLFNPYSESRPFLKWAGGKTQLLKDIGQALPEEIKHWNEFTYIESFVGSGAVLFWMLRNFKGLKRAVINDINTDLITAYQTIKTKPKDLISVLRDYEKAYHAIETEEARREFFMEQRSRFNKKGHDDVENTGLFIFLNRTCFNGLYRVNSKGYFNVPFGKYGNPTICNEQVIWANNYALKNVELLNGDFEETFSYASGNTFFYFDPPYKPISVTASFNAYAKDVFNDAEQERLKCFCDKLTQEGHKFLLSNSDVRSGNPDDHYFDNLFSNYYIDRVNARRMINSDAEKRGFLTELLITNYAKQKAHQLAEI